MSKVFINPGHDPIELRNTYDYDCGAWNPEIGMYENEVVWNDRNISLSGCGNIAGKHFWFIEWHDKEKNEKGL